MSDTETTLNAKGLEMPLSFIDRFSAAVSIDEASDVYLEARRALDHDSPEWRALVEAMHERQKAEPIKPVEPLVVFG